MQATPEITVTVSDLETTGLAFDPDLNCQSAIIQSALDHWYDIRATRKMARPEDLDAAQIPLSVLPHVALLDIEYGPEKKFRWRLIGSAVTGVLQRDLTGRYWDDLYADGAFNLFAEPANRVLQSRAPLRFTAKAHVVGRELYKAEHIYMPMSRDDERVDRLFGISVFTLD